MQLVAAEGLTTAVKLYEMKESSMLSDVLAEAVWNMEAFEKLLPEAYAAHAEEIRKVKLEMMILQGWFDMIPPIAETVTPADLDWLRTEALRRGAERPPYEFEAVFYEVMRDFWKKWERNNDRNSVVGARAENEKHATVIAAASKQLDE